METTEEKRATFTPGPWQLSCIDGVEDSLMVGGGDDGSDIVADIRTYENEISATRNSPRQMWVKKRLAELERQEKEAHANARLIAAAPEMYETCKLLLPIMQSIADDGHIRRGESRKGEHADKLREVLAKVEGGEG